jgi:uncharacterized protein YwlG (UPF0340 family)
MIANGLSPFIQQCEKSEADVHQPVDTERICVDLGVDLGKIRLTMEIQAGTFAH